MACSPASGSSTSLDSHAARMAWPIGINSCSAVCWRRTAWYRSARNHRTGSHQQRGIGDAGFLKLGLQRGQNVALNHVQQRIVASDLKPFPEQQLRVILTLLPEPSSN